MKCRFNAIYGLLILLSVISLDSCKTNKKQLKEKTGYSVVHESKGKSGALGKKLGISISDGDSNMALYTEAADWLGAPYKYGGNSKRGVDCSGMVVAIYDSVYGRKLYRSSYDIHDKNCKKISRKDLMPGDLVFFATGKNKKRINHVGIYLKQNKFIHSSSSKGVIISEMDDAYYRRTFIGCGRVI